MSQSENELQKNNPKAMECGAAISTTEMRRFVEAFQQSARRWEIVVYPALFAFIVLAGYGFFLVYSLTGNMAKIAESLDPDMQKNMAVMSQSIINLNREMNTMGHTMHDISNKLNHLENMQENTRNMETSMRIITATTDQMRIDMSRLNQSVSRPMGFFNNHMPW